MPIEKNLLERLRNNDSSLTELNLRNQIPRLVAEDIRLLMEALVQNQTLTTLDVSANDIGAEGVKALAQNQMLTNLNVGFNQIGAEGAKALAQNKTLTSLNVRDNWIGAEGAKALAQNQTLISLNVSINRIGAEGAKALAQNQTLTTLDVSSNQIGNKGALTFVQNRILTNLNISCNKVGMQLIQTIEQRIAMNRVIQARNHFVITTLLLLRQGRSATPYLPLEIRQLICQSLNFPSMKIAIRSGKEMVEFMLQHLEEFNARLRDKVSLQMIENMKPQVNQSRFGFFATRTTASAKPEIIQEFEGSYETSAKKMKLL